MISYGSAGVNDQLIPVFQGSGLWGLNAVGPTFHGTGQRPPQSIPTGVTSPVSTASATPGVAMAQTTSRGNQTMLLVLAAGAFIVGLIGLRYIHWRH